MTARMTAPASRPRFALLLTTGNLVDLSSHVGVPVIRRRYERLLDGPGRDPAHQVLPGARLVVGTGGTRATERLLPHDRAGRLVVDVEVAGGEAQRPAGPVDDRPIRREDRAGQRVRRGGLGLPDDVLEARVVEDVYGEDRPEVLRGEDLVLRIRALDDRR